MSVAFVKKTAALAEDVLTPFRRTGQGEAPQQPSLASVTISGPYNVTGPGDTSSRRRIFVVPARGARRGSAVRREDPVHRSRGAPTAGRAPPPIFRC